MPLQRDPEMPELPGWDFTWEVAHLGAFWLLPSGISRLVWKETWAPSMFQ